MAGDERGQKRPASSSPGRDAKRPVTDESQSLLPDVPASPPEVACAAISRIASVLRERPFGVRHMHCEWGLKRRLYAVLAGAVAAAEGGTDVRDAFVALCSDIFRCGYAPTTRDRRQLVAVGAWKPAAAAVQDPASSTACKDAAVTLYVSMAEHVSYYDDFFGSHPDFWSPDVFRPMLRHMPTVLAQVPRDMQADQWEMMCQDLESALKCLGSFAFFWTARANQPWSRDRMDRAPPSPSLAAPGTPQSPTGAGISVVSRESVRTLNGAGGAVSASDASTQAGASVTGGATGTGGASGAGGTGGAAANSTFEFDLAEAMPLLDGVVDVIVIYDERFGKDISATKRGDPLEELTRLSGIFSQQLVAQFEDDNIEAPRRRTVRKQCQVLMNFMVRLLMLKIPTCAPKGEANSPGSFGYPVDERQQDSDWIEGLWDHCQQATDSTAVPPTSLAELFRAMVSMPLEEQRYRVECVAPLVSPWISTHAEQLRQKIVPPELADLKSVMNSVLQDDTSGAQDLLDEISFYPCMLDFATKRATIHSVCSRQREEAGSAGDPIRLVVPRDNVLDGVCSSLNLQDAEARIDVPLEIEFRAGYTNDTGQEQADEGEDQGGLRRQWLDRAARHFVASDLFMSPSEDASHLAETAESRTKGPLRSRGLAFVPSPRPVCEAAQEDWGEQFELFGCIMGFALLYKETLPVHLGHNFLRAVFGLKIDADDLLPMLEGVDKTLYMKLKYILDGGYTALGDSIEDVLEQSHLPKVFAISETHCPELVKSTPLKEGGEGISVTEENKQEFVMLMLDRVLISGIAKQVEFFQRGMLRVISTEIMQRVSALMTVKEIELMICGADEIDVDDWESNTQYENGFTPQCQPVRWFWEVVREMPLSSRAALLSFATGSSQVPSGGFRFLQPDLFTIQRVAVVDRYPEAHTCANTIDLPEYTSRETLASRLHFAVDETGDAFGRR